MAHIRQRAGKLPRIVRAPKRSPAAQDLIKTAVETADGEFRGTPVIGYVLMTMYKGGAMHKNVYEPIYLEQGISKDMFWTMMNMGLVRLMVNHQSDHKVRDVHNEMHGLDDPDE